MKQRWSIAVVIVLLASANLFSYAYMSHLAARNSQAAPYPIVKGDSQKYALIADNVLAHGVFSNAPDLSPERQWPPGYALFLSAAKAISGGFGFAVFLEVLLSLGATVLIYLMARRFLSLALALVPALLYGLDPSVILANTIIMSDSVFASLIVASVYLVFFVPPGRREVLRWAGIGALLALATLVRPISEFLIPLALLAYWLQHRASSDNAPRTSPYLPIAAYVLAVVVLLTPWIVRNDRDFGVLEIAHVGANNLLYYNARDFLAWRQMRADGEPASPLAAPRRLSDPAFAVVDAQIAGDLAQATPTGADPANYQGAVATRLILAHPFSYAYFHLVTTVPFFIDSSIAAYQQAVVQERSDSGFFAPTSLAIEKALATRNLSALAAVAPILAEVALWVLLCLAALYGLVARRKDPVIVAFAVLVLYFAFLTGPVSIARYRIPAEPYLLILATVGAALAWSALFRWCKTHIIISPALREFLGYFLASAFALAVDAGTLFVLTSVLGVSYLIAGVLAFLLGLAVTYYASIRWVFRRRHESPSKEFGIFFGVGIAGLGINEVVLWLLTGKLGLYYLLSKAASACIVFLFNFFARKALLFR